MEKNLKIETLRFEKVDGWFCGLYLYQLELGRVKATGLQNRRQIGKHNKEKAAIFGYAAFLIYVSMINHKSEIPQYRFSIEAPEK